MIFVQIYIKILGFGQKTIIMRGDLFEIFLSETSEIYFFDISLVFVRMSLLFSFLEMLIVLYAAPIATPLESERFKYLFTEVILVDFMREVFFSIHIICGRTWLNKRPLDVWIL